MFAESGCLGYVRRLPPPAPELAGPCQALPPECRGRVHVFMVNGLTILPHLCGSMNGVGRYVEELGFCKPPLATHYGRWCLQKKIRRLHQEDPGARFVLVGYCIGASVVYAMAETLQADGIFIDRLIYIDAHSFVHDLSKHPWNVGKIVSISSSNWFLSGKCQAGQQCHRVDTFWHLGVPRSTETLEVLARELTEVAASDDRP
jgi:hypothetical protein